MIFHRVSKYLMDFFTGFCARNRLSSITPLLNSKEAGTGSEESPSTLLGGNSLTFGEKMWNIKDFCWLSIFGRNLKQDQFGEKLKIIYITYLSYFLKSLDYSPSHSSTFSKSFIQNKWLSLKLLSKANKRFFPKKSFQQTFPFSFFSLFPKKRFRKSECRCPAFTWIDFRAEDRSILAGKFLQPSDGKTKPEREARLSSFVFLLLDFYLMTCFSICFCKKRGRSGKFPKVWPSHLMRKGAATDPTKGSEMPPRWSGSSWSARQVAHAAHEADLPWQSGKDPRNSSDFNAWSSTSLRGNVLRSFRFHLRSHMNSAKCFIHKWNVSSVKLSYMFGDVSGQLLSSSPINKLHFLFVTLYILTTHNIFVIFGVAKTP